MARRAGHVRYVFVALTLRAKRATMLAPQQTIIRASANLRCEDAAAKLDFIWILNTLPFRGLRCANMQRRPKAKHCSSLCSQSEGDEDCGGQARAENPTKSWPDALAMFATCSWPSLCEQSELQCWRRNRRLCEPAQISAARALPLNFNFIWILNTLPFRGLRCANMQRRSEAKHCSSLCSQSEGDEDCGGQARAENPTKLCPDALAMFATCSWPSLCEQSELQCWRRNRRLCGPAANLRCEGAVTKL